MAASCEDDLIEAIKSRSLNKTERLLRNGADPNTVTYMDEVSAIHLAAGMGIEAVSLLLQYGGDPNVRSTDGTTPVHVASMWGDSDSLQLLLANGGDPFIKDQDELNAHELATKYNRRAVCEILETYIQLLQPESEHTVTPKYTYKRLSTESLQSGSSANTSDTLDLSVYNTERLDSFLSRITKNRRSSVYLNYIQRQLDRHFSDGQKTHTYDVTSPGYYLEPVEEISVVSDDGYEDLDHPYVERKYFQPITQEQCADISGQSSSDSFVSCDEEEPNTVIHPPLPDVCLTNGHYFPDLQPERQKEKIRTDTSSERKTNRRTENPSHARLQDGFLASGSHREDSDMDNLSVRLGQTDLLETSNPHKKRQPIPLNGGREAVFRSQFGIGKRNASSHTKQLKDYDNDSLISSDESFFCHHPNKKLNAGFVETDYSIISVEEPDTNNCAAAEAYDSEQEEQRDTFNDNAELWDHLRSKKFQTKKTHDTGFCGRNSFCSQVSDASTVDYVYTDAEKGIMLIERHIPSQCGSVGRRSIESSLSTRSDDSSDTQTTVLYDLNDRIQFKDKPCTSKTQNTDLDTVAIISPELEKLNNAGIRSRLCNLGDDPGPVIPTTRQTYLKRLSRLEGDPDTQLQLSRKSPGYPPELTNALNGVFETSDLAAKETQMVKQFQIPDQNKCWREGKLKSSFNYLLLDPRITKDLPNRSCQMDDIDVFKTFISAIFYIGKGKRARPYCHLYEAIKELKTPTQKVSSKVDQIMDIWSDELGVVSLHCFQSVIPVEAYTREACMVDAIGLGKLTNKKRGDYYGIATTYSMKERRRVGVYLLKKTLQIFLAEGERQISPVDIRN